MDSLFDQPYLEKIEDRIFKETVGLRSNGRPIAGLYCAFTPKELVAAAGAIPVALCAGTQAQIPAAEVHLPANLCPLIKSSYGNAVSDTCPYFHMTDFLLADATCDGKKKMFELLSLIRPLRILQLPQTAETPQSIMNWKEELERVRLYLGAMTQTTITDDMLREQIALYNRMRQTVCRVYELNQGKIPALFGREIDIITSSGGFECNLPERMADMEKAMVLAKKRASEPEFKKTMDGRPRILLTGCPTTHKKVLRLIEDSGGVVVCMETCGGLKTAGARVDESKDPMTALAERYLKTPCACMTPNSSRITLLDDLIRQFQVDGVVELTWEACHTYNIESYHIEKAVTQDFNRPYLHVQTDYSDHDTGQLGTRIEAFLEILS
ncbi:MAG: 2-hydroxyacyl-CoA dehydratase family protein [Proteobacteria bacterium]|nr:2-hydroxyacyl-CoA dehydratase family protein [Pseudomonadota bacterium]